MKCESDTIKKQIKCIIFDFDGVMTDSNHIKRSAYYEIFPQEPLVKKVIDEVLVDYGKQPRSVVISEIVERLKKQDLLQNYDASLYIDRYSELTQNKILQADEIKGSIQSLENLRKTYSLFLNTATPDEFIGEILLKRDLDKYFIKALGSTSGSKVENTKSILSESGFDKSEAIFVGDGSSDLNCARALNLAFIGIVNDENTFKDDDSIEYKLPDLEGLCPLIEKINGLKQ